MKTKLTINIEQSLVERAKIYARGKGNSLSRIIENYLKVIVKEEEKTDMEITPIVK